jgi:hypothetical protein
MIEVMPGSQGNVLGLKASGKVTDADYKDILIPRLESIIKDHGKARLLFDFDDQFHEYEPLAVWDDTVFGVKHKNDFEKIALVGGPKWIEWATRISAVFMSGTVKTFSAPETQEAWSWLKS